MKYIFTLTLLLLMSGVLRAEQLSVSVKPVPKPTTVTPKIELERSSSISSKAGKKKLNEFAKEFRRETESQFYIISYAGRRTYSGEALKRANQVKNYLIKNEAIKSERFTIFDAGYKENWEIEIYLLLPGQADPPIDPTINKNEVKFYKVKPQRHKLHAR